MKLLLCSVLVVLCAGCSGIELGGKAWLTRVDERQESQRTYRQSIPLKCYFTNCNSEPSKDTEGS